jgi:glycosyltransferase involved in cell wall biosynthesis
MPDRSGTTYGCGTDLWGATVLFGMKELWLFTRQFPSGSGEVFLETAVPIWSEHFSRVRVFPMFTGKGNCALVPPAHEERLFTDPFATPSLSATVADLPLLLRILRARGAGRSNNARGPLAVLSHARQLMQRYRGLERLVRKEYDPDRVVILCAWMEDWATLFGLLKDSGHPLRFSTMAHRTDLFGSEGAGSAVPFRDFRVQYSDRILCIAQDGVNELQRCYPQQARKLELVRLGTPDRGIAPWSPAKALRIVSCSYLTPRKRVELIAEALTLVDRAVEWTHFGDGPQRAAIEALLGRLPPHIHVDLRGSTSNADVLQAYATTPFDLFLHLSAHEGLPVVLMEAASFGIPLLATDVGGVSEIVDRSTGHLLPPVVSAAEVARWLDHAERYRVLDPHFRLGVRQAWRERFAATSNYGRIARSVEMFA